MRFIEEHRHDTVDGREFGVEPICRVLSEHGCKIAPATYWAHAKRPASARAVRDAELIVEIRRVHGSRVRVVPFWLSEGATLAAGARRVSAAALLRWPTFPHHARDLGAAMEAR